MTCWPAATCLTCIVLSLQLVRLLIWLARKRKVRVNAVVDATRINDKSSKARVLAKEALITVRTIDSEVMHHKVRSSCSFD